MTLLPTHEIIAAEALDRAIDGIGLRARTLRAEIGGGVVLLAFLRHFG